MLPLDITWPCTVIKSACSGSREGQGWRAAAAAVSARRASVASSQASSCTHLPLVPVLHHLRLHHRPSSVTYIDISSGTTFHVDDITRNSHLLGGTPFRRAAALGNPMTRLCTWYRPAALGRVGLCFPSRRPPNRPLGRRGAPVNRSLNEEKG